MDRQRRFGRAEGKIARLSKQGFDMVAFWRTCAPVLADAVPHFTTPCCYTIDPASGLVTSHFQEGMPDFPAEWIAMEYAEDDVNHLTDVARSASGVSTLFEATGGDPSSSPRWHANMAYGGDQEMIAALRSRGGDVWGAISLYRQPDHPLFDANEQAFLVAISPLMADAVRRALLIGESADPEGPDAPGMIVLGPDWRPESMSPGVEAWLRDLPDGNWAASRLPTAVLAVAGRAARSAPSTDDPAEVAVARVLTRSGRWVVLHGVPLAATGSQRVAVIVEPAHASRIAPLLMSAYGLTEREQQLTRLVLQGYSTIEIADRLVISVHTVQGHLRNIFTKTGVRARRDLVTKIFFAHYEPRLRDNEQRTAANRPLRGGPK
ncbi:MAG TPA: LuxR C-terminal-related transcriptional regulator [Propionibacteriaceae bacterium]|nr:LuxR C-terminal-related transcriptional regulator [Propionibacteriaceae bacterium]